jgi:methyltransferase (TIGR00027 family)
MRQGMPSRTALVTAFARAVHRHLDDPPPVLDDHLAYTFLPYPLRRFVKRQAAMPAQFRALRPRDPASVAMRSQIVVRARYAEDCLAEARQAGVCRYVVLGAGLDTFALRQPAPAIDVVEIDHPDTQRWKQSLMQQRGLVAPAQLTFLPVDFERAALADVWPDAAEPELISWLGTTYYLSREGIRATLQTLRERTVSGTELVLDYWHGSGRSSLSPLLMGTRLAVALQGEPMRSFFSRREIEALAIEAGWRVLEHLSPAEQSRRYFAKRKDGLRVPTFAYLLRLGHPEGG